MTWLELVAQEIPELPEAERDGVLWDFTSFPLGSVEEVTEQLREFRRNWLEATTWVPSAPSGSGLAAEEIQP